MTKDSIKKFEKMFDITTDESHSSSEDITETTESFDDLVKEVQGEIKDMTEKGEALKIEDPHDIIKDVSSKSPEDFKKVEKEVETETEIEIETEKDNVEEIDFDELPEQEISKDIVEDIKEEIEVEIVEKPLEVVEDRSIIVDGKIKWSIESPSDMYHTFYGHKNLFLEKCLHNNGGQVEYSMWMKELEEAEVNVVTEVFDQQIIMRQMENVQQHRQRVKFIGVRVNNQYYAFERFVGEKGLLKGYLARIQYLKPALKQEGLILEHMGDLELYFERLKALHKSVADTEKNLAAAYEMLSRKVTICMELPPIERYEKPEKNLYRSSFYSNKEEVVDSFSSKEMDSFDDLPTNAKAGPKEHKVGQVAWGEI